MTYKMDELKYQKGNFTKCEITRAESVSDEELEDF